MRIGRPGGASLAQIVLVSAIWAAPAPAQPDHPLTFDPAAYTLVNITVDGAPMQVRRYRAVYAGKPIAVDLSRPAVTERPAPAGPPPSTANATAPLNGRPAFTEAPTDPLAYQSLYIYVPQASYTDRTTAIILQVNNGGWLASAARDIVREGGSFSSTSDTDNTGAALKAGYVVVSAGMRSRGIRAADGRWIGKAPAVVVDAKAAVRYLRLNDAAMPGSAERIVVTGVSGGGGLSLALAASGNSPDFLPYLAAIGAAGIDASGRSTLRDDVFATIAYCPISDLGNADAAYEWQYGGTRTAANSAGTWSTATQSASAAIAARYPEVLRSLRLRRADGVALDAATMPATITALVRASAEDALARGDAVPALGQDFTVAAQRGPGGADVPRTVRNDWLTIEGGRVAGVDYARFLAFVAGLTRLKQVPAFDGGTAGESSLFGSAELPYSNFTQWAWDNNAVAGDGTGRDDTGRDWRAYTAGDGKALLRQVTMVSPIPYLRGTATAAPYWYVRHGLIDRDTAFAAQVTAYHAIRSKKAVKDADFKLAWMKPHAGNYDVQEAYRWLAAALRKAGAPAGD